MMKTVLLTGSMVIAAPALAQTQAPAAPTAAGPAQTASAPATTPVEITPPTASAAPMQTQVAQVVDQQFGTYDKDADGALSKAEFSAWMTVLKAQANARESDPKLEMAWNDAAFRRADGDRSFTVTRVELTGFFIKGASGAS